MADPKKKKKTTTTKKTTEKSTQMGRNTVWNPGTVLNSTGKTKKTTTKKK